MPPPIPTLIPCDTPHLLTAELFALSSALEKDETEHTWEQIDRAVKRFHAAVRGGATKQTEAFVKGLKGKELASGLVRSMITERTRLSSSTLDLLASITRLGSSFAPLLPLYLPALLRLLCRTNKLYISRATSTLLAIISHTHLTEILKYIVHEWKGESGKSATFRLGAVEGVLAMMGGEGGNEEGMAGGKEGLERRLDEIEWVVKSAATDREPKVRAMAKSVWEVYKNVWPERVYNFTAPLTPVSRRYLNITNGPPVGAPLIKPQHATSAPPAKKANPPITRAAPTASRSVLSASTSALPSTYPSSSRPAPPPPPPPANLSKSVSHHTSSSSVSSSTSSHRSAAATSNPPPPPQHHVPSSAPTSRSASRTEDRPPAPQAATSGFKPSAPSRTASHESQSSGPVVTKKAGRAPLAAPPMLPHTSSSSSLSLYNPILPASAPTPPVPILSHSLSASTLGRSAMLPPPPPPPMTVTSAPPPLTHTLSASTLGRSTASRTNSASSTSASGSTLNPAATSGPFRPAKPTTSAGAGRNKAILTASSAAPPTTALRASKTLASSSAGPAHHPPTKQSALTSSTSGAPKKATHPPPNTKPNPHPAPRSRPIVAPPPPPAPVPKARPRAISPVLVKPKVEISAATKAARERRQEKIKREEEEKRKAEEVPLPESDDEDGEEDGDGDLAFRDESLGTREDTLESGSGRITMESVGREDTIVVVDETGVVAEEREEDSERQGEGEVEIVEEAVRVAIVRASKAQTAENQLVEEVSSSEEEATQVKEVPEIKEIATVDVDQEDAALNASEEIASDEVEEEHLSKEHFDVPTLRVDQEAEAECEIEPLAKALVESSKEALVGSINEAGLVEPTYSRESQALPALLTSAPAPSYNASMDETDVSMDFGGPDLLDESAFGDDSAFGDESDVGNVSVETVTRSQAVEEVGTTTPVLSEKKEEIRRPPSPFLAAAGWESENSVAEEGTPSDRLIDILPSPIQEALLASSIPTPVQETRLPPASPTFCNAIFAPLPPSPVELTTAYEDQEPSHTCSIIMETPVKLTPSQFTLNFAGRRFVPSSPSPPASPSPSPSPLPSVVVETYKHPLPRFLRDESEETADDQDETTTMEFDVPLNDASETFELEQNDEELDFEEKSNEDREEEAPSERRARAGVEAEETTNVLMRSLRSRVIVVSPALIKTPRHVRQKSRDVLSETQV
ncbi:hypothetical protein P7C70_g2521, partial [Phenoliferia sp. Uapishka_3]